MSFRYDTVYKQQHWQADGSPYWVYWIEDETRGTVFVGAWATSVSRKVVTVK